MCRRVSSIRDGLNKLADGQTDERTIDQTIEQLETRGFTDWSGELNERRSCPHLIPTWAGKKLDAVARMEPALTAGGADTAAVFDNHVRRPYLWLIPLALYLGAFSD